MYIWHAWHRTLGLSILYDCHALRWYASPSKIYFTRLGNLSHTLEWLVYQITRHFKLIDFKSGKRMIGHSECHLKRRGGSRLCLAVVSATDSSCTYVDVNDPVKVGGLSLGDRDDIVHFSI